MTPERAEKYFVKQICYWGEKLRIPIEKTFRDNRLWVSARVKWSYGKNYITYNSKHLMNWNIDGLKYIIFHELGHLKYRLPYRNKKQKITSERNAEKFALRMLKKYYPTVYKRRLKHLKKELNATLDYPKHYDYYYEAFKTIPEYKGEEQ
jgi:hypothetical protein